MTDQQMPAHEALVADYVRAAMRVEPPPDLPDAIMSAVAGERQARRSFLDAFSPVGIGVAMAGATAVAVLVSLVLFAPRDVGPAPVGTPEATPLPTITPLDGRVLTEPGATVRIPAIDAAGAFGTISIERGAEKAGYEDFLPVAFQDVFFIELYVTYEPDRATDEQYGEWEFAFAVDTDADGFDPDDVLQRGVGLTGMDGQPGFDSAPEPLLAGRRAGEDVLEGWLVLELPASAAEWDVYLVYGHNEWTDGIQNLEPEASALLRGPGEPVGVTRFDPDAFPTPSGSPPPMPSLHALPSPVPSPLPTFEPIADADADALFAETRTCTNEDLGATITYPAGWQTNVDHADFPSCTFFDAETIDLDAALSGFSRLPAVMIRAVPTWMGGIEEPLYERVTIGDRLGWRITFAPDQMSTGTNYLIPTGDDPYGPFVHGYAAEDGGRPVLERMLLRLVLED